MSLRAFDLIPVLDRLEVKVVCFEACGNLLYLGTEDGYVVCYNVEERTDRETDSTTYSAKVLAQVQLSTKHSVTWLGAASGVGRLLVLVDGILHLLDHKTLVTVTTASKNKGITTFSLNHNPTNPDPFALEVCIGRRRCLQLLLIKDDRVSVLREVPCPEPACVVCMDGVWACVAANGQYTLHNLETAVATPLFPYDAATTPLVRRIMKEEFLLDGPGGLGMFVTCDGVSIRPPINWTDDVLSVAYHHPYILTVSPQFIRIYSVVDQQVKQTVRFSGGSLVGNFDGQVYLASPTSIYCLMPQPWHKQVQVLLNEQRVEEAVELCEQQSAPQHERLVLSVLQRAGFLRLLQEQYNAAADYFIRGKLDPRELLHLFPNALPSSCGFVRSVPPLHQIVDLPTECRGDKRQLARATTFAVEYLTACRTSTTAAQYTQEVDTGLVKLMSRQGDGEQLFDFLCKAVRLSCHVEECATELTQAGMFLPLHKLYSVCGDIEAGMSVLVQLLRGEVHDALYPGPHYCRDELVNTGNAELILKYSTILLEVEPHLGVSLFTTTRRRTSSNASKCRSSSSVSKCRSSSSVSNISSRSYNRTKDPPIFKPQQILSLLDRFPDAKLVYLHHLVDDLQLEEENFHTELALQYADKAVRLAAMSEEEDEDDINLAAASSRHSNKSHLNKSDVINGPYMNDSCLMNDIESYSNITDSRRAKSLHDTDARSKLQEVRKQLHEVLNSSRHFDPATVLACIRHCPQLMKEKASLLGRLGDHEKALRLLIHEMRDFRAAEQYCDSQSKQIKEARKTGQQQPPPELYLLLLKAYLQPENGTVDEQVVAPLDLLSRRGSELPLAAVLQLLPQHWTLAITHTYLRSALAQLLHKRRMTTLQSGVAKCVLQQQSALLAKLCTDAGPVTITQSSVCSVCSERVGGAANSGGGGFIVYPNGVAVHQRCAPNSSVCPVTGTHVANTYTINN